MLRRTLCSLPPHVTSKTGAAAAADAGMSRLLYQAAPGRALSLLMSKDPVLGQLSFADRALIAAETLSLVQAGTSAQPPAHQHGGPAAAVAASRDLDALDAIISQVSGTVRRRGNWSMLPQRLADEAAALGLSLDEFDSYRDTLHYHLLAGLPQRDLCADVTPEPRRLAVVFKLMRAHGFCEQYSEAQVRVAKHEVATHFSDAFIQSNFPWSSDQERYLRRRLLVDASLHDFIVGDGAGTAADLCHVAWITLFDALKARIPRRPKRRPVPAMMHVYSARRQELEHLPFLERVAVILRDPLLEKRLAAATASYEQELKRQLIPRVDLLGDAEKIATSPQRVRQSLFHPWSSLHILQPTVQQQQQQTGDGDGKPLHEGAWSMWLQRQEEQQQMTGRELDPYSSLLMRSLTGGAKGVKIPGRGAAGGLGQLPLDLQLLPTQRLSPQQCAALDKAAEAAWSAAEQNDQTALEESRKLVYTRGGRALVDDAPEPPTAAEDKKKPKTGKTGVDEEPQSQPQQQPQQQKPQPLAAPTVVVKEETSTAFLKRTGLPLALYRLIRRAVDAVPAEVWQDPTVVPPELLALVERAVASVRLVEDRTKRTVSKTGTASRRRQPKLLLRLKKATPTLKSAKQIKKRLRAAKAVSVAEAARILRQRGGLWRL